MVIYFYNSKILTQDDGKDTQYRLTISELPIIEVMGTNEGV